MLVVCFLFNALAHSGYFHHHVRRFFDDYGMPISLIACSALAYWGRFNSSNPETLPIGGAFQPAGGRDWLVRFWELPGKWVGIALPFGVILWILFFFDHNVSVRSLIRWRCIPGLIDALIVSYCTRIRVSFEETTWLPLRLLFARCNYSHCRTAGSSCSKWPHPSSTHPHKVPCRDGPTGQRR